MLKSIILLGLVLGLVTAVPLIPNATQYRIKTAQLNGNLGFTVAEFGMKFDQPLYFQYPAPCPAGRCPISRQPDALAADPCSFMPCDFTLKGSDCGRARLPQCESYCASRRSEFCPPIQDWITLTLGIESEPILLSSRDSDQNLRVNFDQPCKAIVFQVITIYGSGPVLTYHVDTINPNIDHCCQLTQPPEEFNAICPAFEQCYRYGTYFMKLRCFEPESLVTVRVFALDIEAGDQRTVPLPDAPPLVIPDPNYPFHVPLMWSVPFTYTFAPASSAIPLVLSSYYCGFVTLQVNMEYFDNTVLTSEGFIIFVSTDPLNPFPSSITTDTLFLSLPFTKIYICATDTPAHLFVLLVRSKGAAFGTEGIVTVTVDYDRDGLIAPYPPQKAGDIGSWSNYTAWPASNWYAYGPGALQINCPGFPSFDCTAGCEKFGCCQNTWPTYPTGGSLQPLYPVPYPLRFLNQDIILNDFVYFPKYLDPHRLGVTLVLEQNFGGSIQFGPLGDAWEDILPQCTLSRSNSGLGTLDGRWIDGIHTPVLASQECDYETFVEISTDLDSIFELLIEDSPDNIGTTRPLSLRYRADILTMLDGWIDCQSFVQDDLLSLKTLSLVADNTKTCPIYVDDDPCCNPSLAWNQCCIPRDLDFDLEFPSEVAETFNQTCQLETCALPILQSYAQGTLTEVTGGCEPAILESPSQITTQAIAAVATCLQSYFGNDFEGIDCFDDMDCPTQNHCDIIARKCTGNLTLITQGFVECVVDAIAPPIRLSLIAEQNWIEAVKSRSLVDLILDTYTQSYCVQRAYPIPGTLLRPYFKTTTAFAGCPPGNSYTLTSSTTPVVWQAARQISGGNCAYDFSTITPNVDLNICHTTGLKCNWDPTITTTTACAAPSDVMCAICETEESCREVEAASCEGAEVCVLANGQILYDQTETQCKARLSCTDPAYSDQTSCQASGVCIDKESIYYALDNTYWAGSHSRTGVCAFSMAPYDVYDCNVYYPGSFPSSYGCISFGRCTATGFVLDCEVDYDSLAACNLAGGLWYPRPQTQDQCHNPTLCDVPRYTGTRTATWESTFHYLSEFPSVEDCESCGGTVRPVNEWRGNRWMGGVMRRSTWTPRRLVEPYVFMDSLDFFALSRIVIEAAEASTRFQTLNALQCSYGNQKVQVQTLACNCLAELNSEECFQQNTIAPLGQGQFCPFTSNQIVSPPFALASNNNTLAPDMIYECAEFGMSKIAIQSFDLPPPPSVTIAFRTRIKFNFEPQSYASVFNSKGALVGSAIGDGIQLNIVSPGSIQEIYLCATIPTSITPDQALYPVFDFGKVALGDGAQIRPLHVPTSYDPQKNRVCATVRVPPVDQIGYAPLIRLINDETPEGTALTDGQEACLYIVATLFVGGVGYWVFMIYDLGSRDAFNITAPSIVVWTCAVWIFLQRSIYLYLVAAGVLNEPNDHQLVDYFMMDFPMCVYLIGNFQIGLSFIFLYFSPKEDARRFWYVFSAGSFLIVMIFISALLAYRYEVLATSGITGALLCPTYNDTTDTARVIRLIYQSIILAVSVCIGLTELILGLSLYRKMAEVIGSERILLLCVTASVGIISDSVAFLIYYIVDDPSPYFSIVLIFTEILPIAYLIYQLRIFGLKNAGLLSSSHSSDSSRTQTQMTSPRITGMSSA